MTIQERNALVEQHMPIADRIVGMVLRSGERACIDADELRARAYLALVLAVKQYRPEWGIGLEERIARKVENYLVRLVRSENRHWRNRVDMSELTYRDDEQISN